MRVIHKGYAATVWGKNHMTISDRDGKIIEEDHERDSESYTDMELRMMIEGIINGEREPN